MIVIVIAVLTKLATQHWSDPGLVRVEQTEPAGTLFASFTVNIFYFMTKLIVG